MPLTIGLFLSLLYSMATTYLYWKIPYFCKPEGSINGLKVEVEDKRERERERKREGVEIFFYKIKFFES